MTLEFALVALQCGSRGGVRKDVAYGLPPSELACALYGGAGGLLQVLGMRSAVSRVVRHTFHQRLPIWTMCKPLLQIIRRTLPLQLKRLRLQCPIY